MYGQLSSLTLLGARVCAVATGPQRRIIKESPADVQFSGPIAILESSCSNISILANKFRIIYTLFFSVGNLCWTSESVVKFKRKQ